MSGAPDTSGKKNTIQAQGSSVTYLQRYSLIGALGLTTADEDIDGRVDSETITEGQASSIKARLEATGSNVQAFCHMLAIPNVDAMPAGKYASADKKLTQKEVTQAWEGALESWRRDLLELGVSLRRAENICPVPVPVALRGYQIEAGRAVDYDWLLHGGGL